MTIGQRIKELRLKHGWSQSDLADKLELSQSSVGMYEINEREPGIKTIIKLAEMFNVSTDYIVGRDTKEINSENMQVVKVSLGSRIQELRTRRGYTQFDIAKKLEMTEANFSSYERDKSFPPSNVLSKIADILKASTDYLLMRTENPYPIDEEYESWLIEIAQASDSEKRAIKEVWNTIKKMKGR